jgi:hypothetical protein
MVEACARPLDAALAIAILSNAVIINKPYPSSD